MNIQSLIGELRAFFAYLACQLNAVVEHGDDLLRESSRVIFHERHCAGKAEDADRNRGNRA